MLAWADGYPHRDERVGVQAPLPSMLCAVPFQVVLVARPVFVNVQAK